MKLKALVRAVKKIEIFTDQELQEVPSGSIFVFDSECYINYFLVAFKCVLTKKYVLFEKSQFNDNLNTSKLGWMLWRFCIVGFNSQNYDIPLIELALKGSDNAKLKEASDYIIKSGKNYGTKKVTSYDFEKKYKIKIGNYNHIDLFNVCPVNNGLTENPASLKTYAGRLHALRLQDLPLPEDHVLTAEDCEIMAPYCCNDLDNTENLFEELSSEIKLRIEMSKEYGVDLRSKSDAQIAEAVVNSELEKILGYKPTQVNFKETFVKYNVPDFICFKSKSLNKILKDIENAEFYFDGMGSPLWPKDLGEFDHIKDGERVHVLKVKIGKAFYKLGMGGLHSQETSIAHIAGEDEIIADNDAESFYPRTILNQKLCPPQLGEAFYNVYKKIVDTRIEAKAKAKECETKGDREGAKRWKKIADSLKIVINGLFGKLGNKYSTVYAPQLMLQVTLTGQLVLLMLIEALEDIGIEVISGNTDGIVSKYHKDRHEDVRNLIKSWEVWTSYKTEETRYSAVYSRDVNNYIAIKCKGGDKESKFFDEKLGAKTKGAYSERGSALNSVLSKNPENLVCIDAMLNFLINKEPIENTIRNCKDIKRFSSVRNVKGGGQKDGQILGKVVRWYYAKGEQGCIQYLQSGNKVPKTDGAKPLMDLPESFPIDVDYSKYIKETIEMLYDCGRYEHPKTESLF
jgi:DNA polymerase family B